MKFPVGWRLSYPIRKDWATTDRAELKTCIAKLGEQTNRCRNIARNMLGFVRGSGPSADSFDLHELLKNSVSFLFPELKSKDVEVLFDFMEGPLADALGTKDVRAGLRKPSHQRHSCD